MKEKWMAIIGSPRRGKNTELLTNYVIEALGEKNIIVEKYYLKSSNMTGCTACEYCISEGECNIEDGFTKVINEMKSVDGYILAAPSYNYNVPAQMKVLIDRTFSLNDYTGGKWKSRLSSGKKAIIIGNCKGKTKEYMGYTVEAMRKAIDELGVDVIDIIEYYNTKHIPVINNNEIKGELNRRIKSNPKL